MNTPNDEETNGSSQSAKPEQKSRMAYFQTAHGALISVASILGALATIVGVVTQTGLFHHSSSGATNPPSPNSSPSPVHEAPLSGDYKIAVGGSGAILVPVPVEWEYHDSGFDPSSRNEPDGKAMRAASSAAFDTGALDEAFAASLIYIGAGRQFAKELGIRGVSAERAKMQLLKWLRKQADWGSEGCS